MQHAATGLHEDATFSLAVTMADLQAWLHLDYYSGDDVQHLALATPPAGTRSGAQDNAAALRLGGGAARKVYEGRAGERGTDLVVAIASTERLFAQARPETERAAAYIEALRRALRDRPADAVSADAARLVIEP